MKVSISCKAFLSKACYSSPAFSSTEKEQVMNIAECFHLVKWKTILPLIQTQVQKECWMVLHAVRQGEVISRNYYGSIIFIPVFRVQLYSEQKINLRGETCTLQPYLKNYCQWFFFPHSFQGVLSERVRGKEREQLEFLIQLECSKRVIKITLPVITI